MDGDARCERYVLYGSLEGTGHVNCTTQLGLICKLAEGALNPSVYVTDEDAWGQTLIYYPILLKRCIKKRKKEEKRKEGKKKINKKGKNEKRKKEEKKKKKKPVGLVEEWLSEKGHDLIAMSNPVFGVDKSPEGIMNCP
ncbi:hypothetical protein llap_17806 [Limosa lapponica baueri]|uniref:Uncharacterized protein n=1 Tax=Limosa lapponica baueri TaxID=1758121 RepID=A0A2I0TDK4_LIMLA|nr:hypothetical protein llap_17806 [Limosa lapponica baueri]